MCNGSSIPQELSDESRAAQAAGKLILSLGAFQNRTPSEIDEPTA
jgi:hypothetical protein